MTFTIRREGTYELFRASDGARIIAIDDSLFEFVGRYFTLAEGDQGELARRHPSTIDKETVFRRGLYKLVEFSGETQFQNIPYLFLDRDGRFEEIYLPDGLPSSDNDHARFIITDHTIAAESLTAYLDSEQPSSVDLLHHPTGTEPPPFDDYFDLTAGDLARRIRQMQPAELRRLEEYESRHKNRSTILNTIRTQYRH